MAKDLPVTLDGKVIYHIKLTDSFQGLAEELKQLGYQADQKICIVTDSNVAKLYAETVKNMLLEKAGFKDIIIVDTAGISSMYAADGGVIVVV